MQYMRVQQLSNLLSKDFRVLLNLYSRHRQASTSKNFYQMQFDNHLPIMIGIVYLVNMDISSLDGDFLRSSRRYIISP